MAAAMMSMSESIQASVMIQRQINSDQKSQQTSQLEQHKGVGFFVQVSLVFALFGIEMVIAFEQIYLILIHQFLGVPVSLLSVNGIICGAVSMTFLPILGCFTDRGTNPKRRKMMSLFVGMSMFLGGLVLLATGGFIKLETLDAENKTKHDNGTTFNNLSIIISNEQDGDFLSDARAGFALMDVTTTDTPASHLTTASISETVDSSQIPVTAFLSIVGFSFIDIGFDMSISLTRAFILESVPKHQHTRLLVLATIVASVAGTTFSFLGCFDFPGALGSLFHAEGVAVTLIFFCSLLFCIILIGYNSTIITGCVINRKQRVEESAANDNREASTQTVACLENVTTPRSHRKLVCSRIQNSPQQKRTPKNYVPDIIHTEEGDASTKPLLLEDSLKQNDNYAAMSISTSSLYPTLDTQEMTNHISHCKYESASFCGASRVEYSSERYSDAEDRRENMGDVRDRFLQQPELSSLATVDKKSYSVSASTDHPTLGDFHDRKLNHLQKNCPEKGKKQSSKSMWNKRLVILCFSAFFTSGCLITFIVYISNALNIGIYHGDPTALPGTEAYDLYQAGLRVAALGNLVLYVTYMLVSINNTRLINLIGEKTQFVACHSFLIVSLLTLILSKRVEVYFVFMICCGAYRTCLFTLPFILANKFTQDQNVDNSVKPQSNVGKIMSLIGFLIPAHYILVSAFMGPLMDATGDVWMPLIYSLCSCTMALLIFILLFFVKN